jgi:FSR family fosmidomycin resistance protein-like MFS transporter
MQSVLYAIYPLIKQTLSLNYFQVGLIGAVFNITASVLQPIFGHWTDRHPKPYSLLVGMTCTLCGLILLGYAPTYGLLLIGAAMIGTGSSIFHPEASRIARIASGGRYGLAQSLFQTGGNAGQAIGPLLAALIIVPNGQHSAADFALIALAGIGLLAWIAGWYKQWLIDNGGPSRRGATGAVTHGLSLHRVSASLAILIALVFSKFFYLSSLNSFYIFYLMEHFGLDVRAAQLCLFLFNAATAAGTILGGPIGDRIGARSVIWVSILGVLPFTMLLPYSGLGLTVALTIPIGLILASAFSVIIVYAQSLLPGRVGLVSGLFFGLAFGMSGLGSAALGKLADVTSIETVFRFCAFLPAIGLLALWLPRIGHQR